MLKLYLCARPGAAMIDMDESWDEPYVGFPHLPLLEVYYLPPTQKDTADAIQDSSVTFPAPPEGFEDVTSFENGPQFPLVDTPSARWAARYTGPTEGAFRYRSRLLWNVLGHQTIIQIRLECVNGFRVKSVIAEYHLASRQGIGPENGPVLEPLFEIGEQGESEITLEWRTNWEWTTGVFAVGSHSREGETKCFAAIR